MRKQSLKKLFKEAENIVADLPAHLQGAAFPLAFNSISDRTAGGLPEGDQKQKLVSKFKPVPDVARTQTKDATHILMNGINRTKYPKMEDFTAALDCSLYLLQIAKDDMGIDGLNPVQISKVLRDKFRKKISQNAASMALMGAGKFVDRIKEGRGFIYKIMGAGERHIKSVSSTKAGDALK